MGRNALACLGCPCFSSGNPAASSSSKGYASSSADTVSSPDTQVHGRRMQQVDPSFKLLPLPSGPAFPDHAVGIDDQVDRVIRLLEWEDVTNVAVAVVLHGFGGTGKTTLADAVVATLDVRGWNCFTVAPFGSAGNVEDGQAEQAFIYMDNANANVMLRKEDVEMLVPKPCKRLRLLLTARDVTVADVILGSCGIRTHVYPIRPLDYQDAMKLLCNKIGVAGGMLQMPQHQIDELLKICDGVPVILERVGAYICQSPDKPEAFRRVIEWCKGGKPFSSAEDQLSVEKRGLLFDLEEFPASARESFLDICSFFNGWDWNKVSSIVGEDELNSLRNRALLLNTEESQNKVKIHPIVLTIGRNMTKGTRFTSADGLTKVLEGSNLDHNIGGIKGIWLEDNISEPFLMSAKKLDLMHNSLRVLALGDMTIVVDGQCKQKFHQIIYFQAGMIPRIPLHPIALQGLRYLNCRLGHNKNGFQQNKIMYSTTLKMLFLDGRRNAHVVDIAGVLSRLQGLRILQLVWFETLKILPDQELSLLTELEELDVTGCRNLHKLPQGLGNVKCLTKLSLQCCRSLQELPDSFGKLRSLKYLNLLESSVKRLPDDFGSLIFLEELLLESDNLKVLPTSFANLSSLKVLNLSHCRGLEYLPDNIGNLKSLTKLSLQNCISLKELPDSFGKLTSLKYLSLLDSSVKRLPEDFGSLTFLEELVLRSKYLTELPSSFEKLSSLKVLSLRNCRRLKYLPDNIGNLATLVKIELEGSGLLGIPPSLERLSSLPASAVSLEGCGKLKDLPEEFCCYLKLVKDLSFQSCRSLSGLPKRLVELASLTRLDLSYCARLKSLPAGFGQLKSLAVLDLERCDSLQHLSADFHCLASLRNLIVRKCMELGGEWMDTLAKIKTLDLVDIAGSEMLVERWAEMEKEGESWQFSVKTNYEMGWKYGENMLNKASLKFFTGKCLLKNSREEPFSLSSVAPNTILLVLYIEHHKASLTGPVMRLLEEIVMAHETQFMPFQIICVGNYFGQLSKEFADRILAYTSNESEAFLLFHHLLEVTEDHLSHFVITEVAADGEGRKHFSRWENITDSGVGFLLSKSKVYADLLKLTETPQESNVKLLKALVDTAESRATPIFIKNCTESVGVDKLRGKTVLLLISHINEHSFEALTDIYSQLRSTDNLEILSIPIPFEVGFQRFPPRWMNQANSELVVFESILRKVPWPVLRNPWLLKTEVCYFIEREWGKLNPGIVVVVDPNGRILKKNALPLIETWGAEVCPFTQEKMKQLEEERLEECLSEYIINGLREMEQLILLP